MSCPLDGIRVLDLSGVLAGPWASQTLADLGAEVIKVERPGTGDDTRSWGPPYAIDARGKSTSDSAHFLATNRGKKSVTIDIADPQGQNAIRELARTSDVLIENFKVGGLAKYGLDYGTLATIIPRLVYCAVTGFGERDPYRKRGLRLHGAGAWRPHEHYRRSRQHTGGTDQGRRCRCRHLHGSLCRDRHTRAPSPSRADGA